MCNTLAYTYTCAHTLSHRRSACAGTKHKPSRSGPKAACLPEPCLTVRLGRVCGACELGAWEEAWRIRLERARGFVEAVRGGGTEGGEGRIGGERGGGESEEDPSPHPTPSPAKPSTTTTTASALRTLTTLLTTLQATHLSFSWGKHTSLPRRPKSRTPRVPPTVFTRAPSPLRHEVLPQDVVVPAQQKAWSEVRVEEFDWGYVASTDPLHPVCAVYGFEDLGTGEGKGDEGEAGDGAWGFWGLDGEDGEGGGGGEVESEAGSEDPGSAWEWDHRDSELDGGSEHVHVRLRGGDAQEQEREGSRQDGGGHGLEAWSGDEAGKTLAAESSDVELGTCRDMDADVEEIVKAFWAVVNEGFEPGTYGMESLR